MEPEPEITIGSIETLVVDVDDFFDNLISLDGIGCVFDVFARDLVTPKMQNVAITVTAPNFMRARCLVNTTLGGLWTAGKYALYLRFPANPDTPRLGPLWFQVNP